MQQLEQNFGLVCKQQKELGVYTDTAKEKAVTESCYFDSKFCIF
jgi:hypothetical protein